MARSERTIIPLNCVDKSLLALDCEKARMVFHGIFAVEGDVDLSRLSQAVTCALRCRVGMRTVVRRRRFGHCRQICEISDRQALDLVEVQSVRGWSDAQADAECETRLCEWINRPLNMGQAFPFRVLLLEGNGHQHYLVFSFHHSSADGIRGLRFMWEVLDRYNDGSVDSSEVEDVRVCYRGDELLRAGQSQRCRVKHFRRKMFSALFYRFFVAPLHPPSRVLHGQSGKGDDTYICYATLKPSELHQIESKSKSAGASVNDILLAACFRTVEKWNRSWGKTSKKITVMVPVNLRPTGFRDVISNQVSFVSVSIGPRDRADPARLLRAVNAKMREAIKHGTAFAMVYFLHSCSRLPLPVMKVVARFFILTRVYIDTVLLTNLGVVWPSGAEGGEAQMGGLRIVNFVGAVPVVDPMGMSIYAGVYNRSLTVCLAYKTAYFSKEQARVFLDLYLEQARDYPIGPETSPQISHVGDGLVQAG